MDAMPPSQERAVIKPSGLMNRSYMLADKGTVSMISAEPTSGADEIRALASRDLPQRGHGRTAGLGRKLPR
jgi:hypothetical protein